MALFTLVSAVGSPGVTSTALALAVSWPRPVVLVEADPSGSSAILAGYFRGQEDKPGLVDLVTAQRSGVLSEAVGRVAFEIPGTQASVLAGGSSHEQAAGLAKLWEPLFGVLRDVAGSGQDVLVDGGRLGLEGWPRPFVAHSDMTVLVSRSTLPALVGARSWAATLAADVIPGHEAQIALVGEGMPYKPREVSRALGLPVVGSLEWDPDRARVFSEGAAKPSSRLGENRTARAFAGSALMRSVVGLGQAMRQQVEGAGRDSLLRGMVAHRMGEEARA